MIVKYINIKVKATYSDFKVSFILIGKSKKY